MSNEEILISRLGYSEESLTKVHSCNPCRSSQIDLLLSLFGPRCHASVPSLFVYGHTATGKSRVLTSIFECLGFPHVYLSCIECFTPKLIFEFILDNLSGNVPSPLNDWRSYAKCDNMADFILLLKKFLKEQDLENETSYIVFDKAERLRDMSPQLLPALSRIAELVDANICVIFISEIVWEKFRSGTGMREPFIVHFSDYSRNNLLEIMSRDCPEDFTEEFYQGYLSLILSVFYSACQDLNELRHLASMNFNKYTEPIKKGECSIDDSRKLWRAIEPNLKKALHTIYLREVSSSQWEQMQENLDPEDKSSAVAKALSSRVHIELPFYTKYLLIAAYLASYNPAKTDKRFFVKRCEKMTKRKNLANKNERASNHLLGPKAFPLDRLMAIFYSIVEGKVAPTAAIFSQIPSLISLNLLTHAGGDDLDGPKYKCLVSLDFIRSVSRTVNFDVKRYLYDFV